MGMGGRREAMEEKEEEKVEKVGRGVKVASWGQVKTADDWAAVAMVVRVDVVEDLTVALLAVVEKEELEASGEVEAELQEPLQGSKEVPAVVAAVEAALKVEGAAAAREMVVPVAAAPMAEAQQVAVPVAAVAAPKALETKVVDCTVAP